MITPFLKWPGGKGWLFRQHPELFQGEFERYFEPFLGSGAMFFLTAPKRGHLNDSNSELITTYRAIRDRHEKVTEILQLHHSNHSKDYYYKIRSLRPKKSVEVAARMIYLNRTCWNGLYRVNLNGDFNVPIGTKKNVVMRIDDFPLIAERLHLVKISNTDFSASISRAREGDFIFADPPYYSRYTGAKFHKYSSNLFTFQDHERLAKALYKASRRGAKIVMTHSLSTEIAALYEGKAEIILTDRRDTLSAKSQFRGSYREMIISMNG